jgi:DNA-binding MarR family transcriptional regulator
VRYDDAAAVNRAIRRAAIRHRARAGALLATLGLNIGQEILLFELAAHGERTQAQLASGAGCEPPTITMAVRKLEAAGLVRRTPSVSDARAIVVSLTDEGRALLPAVRAVLQQLADETVAGMSRADREALVRLLGCAAGNLSTEGQTRADVT